MTKAAMAVISAAVKIVIQRLVDFFTGQIRKPIHFRQSV